MRFGFQKREVEHLEEATLVAACCKSRMKSRSAHFVDVDMQTTLPAGARTDRKPGRYKMKVLIRAKRAIGGANSAFNNIDFDWLDFHALLLEPSNCALDFSTFPLEFKRNNAYFAIHACLSQICDNRETVAEFVDDRARDEFCRKHEPESGNFFCHGISVKKWKCVLRKPRGAFGGLKKNLKELRLISFYEQTIKKIVKGIARQKGVVCAGNKIVFRQPNRCRLQELLLSF
jgi:hypothetical protein